MPVLVAGNAAVGKHPSRTTGDRGRKPFRGVRRALVLAVLVFVWAPRAAAQEPEAGSGIAEAIREILDFRSPGWSLVRGDSWAVAVARVGEGEERRLSFPVEAGRDYRVVGAGAASALDLDICVFGPEAGPDAARHRAEVCHVLPDAVPDAEFTAAGAGVHEAVLTAVSADASPSYAAMAVFERAGRADAGAEPGSPYDLTTVTTLGALGGSVPDGWDLVPGGADWGLVVGAVVEGGGRDVAFEVEEGNTYLVSGAGGAAASDLDICVSDDAGNTVGCDTVVDAVPRVAFTASSSGVYEASLEAYAIENDDHSDLREPVSARAGLVVSVRGADRCAAWRLEPDYFRWATVFDVENCIETWTKAAPVDSEFGTPLLLAARDSKSADAIRLMLGVPGLDTLTDAAGHTTLHLAMAHSPASGEVGGLLLEHNPDLLHARAADGATPLHLAVGRVDADLDAIDGLLAAASARGEEADVLLATDAAENTPLHVAAAAARRPVVVRRLVAGAPRRVRTEMLTSANIKNRTPLELARERKGADGVVAQLESYDEEFINLSMSQRVANLLNVVEPVLATGGALIVFLFTFVRTFPRSGIARWAHRVFNSDAVEAILDD